MAFKPDEIRSDIERSRIERMARESFRRQAHSNLINAKNPASDQNTRLKDRDDSIRHQIANNVTKHQVPVGTDVKGMMELTFGNDKGELSKKLTDAKLKQYALNVMAAQERFAGGITPKQVIDLSTDIDRERCNKQIFLAAFFNRSGDTFRYMTNAGPDSTVENHYVTVQFLGYEKLLSGGRDKGVSSVGKYVTGGKIRFTCDCGRHRYYYNYMAGLGNYQLGHKETRVPFIRNEHLVGVACKHALRVMQVILSSTGAELILAKIKQDRARINTKHKAQNTTKADLKAQYDLQLKRADNQRSQVIPTTEKKSYKAKMQRAALAEAKKLAARQVSVQRQKQEQDAMLATLIAAGFTDAQIKAFRK